MKKPQSQLSSRNICLDCVHMKFALRRQMYLNYFNSLYIWQAVQRELSFQRFCAQMFGN